MQELDLAYEAEIQDTINKSRPKISYMAIFSLVLGVLGPITLGLCSIGGLILGISALVYITHHKDRVRGGIIAIIGVMLSSIGIGTITGAGLYALADYTKDPLLTENQWQKKYGMEKSLAEAQMIFEMNRRFEENAREIALAMHLYANDWAMYFPEEADWPGAISRYLAGGQDRFISPFDPEGGRAFAMNSNLRGASFMNISEPERTVLFFECAPGGAACGTAELMAKEPRSPQGFLIGYADGHVEVLRPGMLYKLKWLP
jgi:hypothetical protein